MSKLREFSWLAVLQMCCLTLQLQESSASPCNYSKEGTPGSLHLGSPRFCPICLFPLLIFLCSFSVTTCKCEFFQRIIKIGNIRNLLYIYFFFKAVLLTKVHLVKAMVFPVVMCRCESWTIQKAECQRIDVLNCGVEDS